MRTPLLLAALSLNLLSGCLGGPDAPGDGGDADALDADGRTGLPRPAPTGNVAEVSFSWSGATDVGVCVPQDTTSCTGHSQQMGTIEWLHAAAPGATASVQATLTWTHRVEPVDDLRIDLYATTSCGGGCTSYRSLEGVAGTSPLTLESRAHALEDGEDGFAVAVRDARPLIDDPVLSDARHSREFDVEGILFLAA